MESIWEHSTPFRRACEERSAGTAPEMDCARQLASLLRPHVKAGVSLLDVGCAGGHYYHSLKPLGIDYHGIDSSPTAIGVGQKTMPAHGLAAARLRLLAVENLPPDERYDVVVSFNTLMYCANFHQPLDRMARAARSLLVIRDCFEARTTYRWAADPLLDDGFRHLHAYFNIWSRDEVKSFLEARGFAVTLIEDDRRRTRFGGVPEVVGGFPLPYEILLCERRPS